MSGGSISVRSAGAVLVLLILLWVPSRVMSGETEFKCDFDPLSPSLENARQNFDHEDYNCATLELRQLLAIDTLRATVKADVHALLAAVHFATTGDRDDRRQKVRKEFVKVFRACRYWRGDLAIPQYEFRKIMKDARELVNWQLRNVPEEKQEVVEVETIPPPPPRESRIEKKPWYRKWWALGSGVGVVAIAAILVIGSGDDSPPPDPVPLDTLPNFPPPP